MEGTLIVFQDDDCYIYSTSGLGCSPFLPVHADLSWCIRVHAAVYLFAVAPLATSYIMCLRAALCTAGEVATPTAGWGGYTAEAGRLLTPPQPQRQGGLHCGPGLAE